MESVVLAPIQTVPVTTTVEQSTTQLSHIEQVLTQFFATESTATVTHGLLDLYALMVESGEYTKENQLKTLNTVSEVIKLVSHLQTFYSI